MTLTPTMAVDNIMAIFKSAWDTTGYDAFYEDVKNVRETDQSPWAVITLRHASGGQQGIGIGGGCVAYTRLGMTTVQIFTPIGKGLQQSYTLAKLVCDAYEGSSAGGGVRFRNVRINEIGRDGNFFQNNVIIDFEYDEFK